MMPRWFGANNKLSFFLMWLNLADMFGGASYKCIKRCPDNSYQLPSSNHNTSILRSRHKWPVLKNSAYEMLAQNGCTLSLQHFNAIVCRIVIQFLKWCERGYASSIAINKNTHVKFDLWTAFLQIYLPVEGNIALQFSKMIVFFLAVRKKHTVKRSICTFFLLTFLSQYRSTDTEVLRTCRFKGCCIARSIARGN